MAFPDGISYSSERGSAGAWHTKPPQAVRRAVHSLAKRVGNFMSQPDHGFFGKVEITKLRSVSPPYKTSEGKTPFFIDVVAIWGDTQDGPLLSWAG